jgi:glutaredoxin
MKCPHCKFLNKTFKFLKRKDSTNREYWLFTEMFVHLHGKDYCDYKKGFNK